MWAVAAGIDVPGVGGAATGCSPSRRPSPQPPKIAKGVGGQAYGRLVPRGDDRSSNCSSGLPVDLFWHGCPEECEQERHIDAMVDALIDAIGRAPNRQWNSYTETYARREFWHCLVSASRGDLKPLDHVKHIETPMVADLFEIRWTKVNVAELDAKGRERGRPVEARLLHAEPDAMGVCAIGLHAHEKVIVRNDARVTRAAQDAEIATAVSVYATAVPALLRKSPACGLRRDAGTQ